MMTKVTDAGMKSVAALSSLRELDLTSTAVGDDGVGLFTKLTWLEVLSLGSCRRVTDASFVHLSRLPRLKEVFLYETGVSERSLRKFKRDHPQIEVTH